jgi:hypothetical protein
MLAAILFFLICLNAILMYKRLAEWAQPERFPSVGDEVRNVTRFWVAFTLAAQFLIFCFSIDFLAGMWGFLRNMNNVRF